MSFFQNCSSETPKRYRVAALLIAVGIGALILAPVATPAAIDGVGASTAHAAEDASGEDREPKGCVWGEEKYLQLDVCLARLVNTAMLRPTHYLVGWAGMLMEVSVNKTVVEMGAWVSDTDAIDIAWTMLRDIANIAFIFILLYIAVMLIFRADTNQTKKLLLNVVLVALLINFSMFLTQVVIDVSNIFAIEFYKGVVGGNELGISKDFLEKLEISSAYKGTGEEGAIGNLTNWGILMRGLMGSALMIVVAFVLAAAAFLLILRFVVLIFLIIVSPIAFAAFILPQTAGYAKQWLSKLISESFYAPAFFILLAVSMKIVDGYKSQLEMRSFANAMSENPANADGAAATFLNFIIMMLFFAGALILAKKLGASGATKAVGVGQKGIGKVQKKLKGGAKRTAGGARRAAGGAAAGTIGRGAARANERLGNTRLGQTWGVHGLRNATLGKLESGKFGSKKSGKDRRKDAQSRVNRKQALGRQEEAQQSQEFHAASRQQTEQKLDTAQRDYRSIQEQEGRVQAQEQEERQPLEQDLDATDQEVSDLEQREHQEREAGNIQNAEQAKREREAAQNRRDQMSQDLEQIKQKYEKQKKDLQQRKGEISQQVSQMKQERKAAAEYEKQAKKDVEKAKNDFKKSTSGGNLENQLTEWMKQQGYNVSTESEQSSGGGSEEQSS